MSTDSDYRRVVAERYRFAALELDKLINQSKIVTTIDFYGKVTIDSYGTVTVGEWGGYLIQIMPMAFNDRLVMTPKSCLGVYDYGWCFPKGAAPLLAAMVWNPQREAEPKGFIKRVGHPPRLAGQKAVGAPDDEDD